MTFTQEDRCFMEKALSLAAKGRGYVEPNPMVGAVIVKDGGIIAEGCHARFGGPHAEVAALQDARRRGMETSGATLYLTLEPCAHYGKTPPCAPALVEAGLKRVVMATLDPLWVQHASRAAGRPAGRGMELLLEAGISVETGLCQDEAVLLNAGFFKLARTALPLVIAKWAMSADGKIATRTGSSRWISCADSRRLVHELRGMVDAILVGSSTVERDDPLLTCREAEPRRIATRVALCGSKAPSAQAQLVRTARLAPTILAFAEGHEPPGLAALKGEGCELLPLPASQHGGEGVDLRSLLASLAKRGASNVLVEGGREVLGSFFDDGLIDRVMIFIAPFIIGGREAVGAVGGRGVENIRNAVPFAGRSIVLCQEENSLPALRTTVRQVGRDLLVEGWISNPLEWLP